MVGVKGVSKVCRGREPGKQLGHDLKDLTAPTEGPRSEGEKKTRLEEINGAAHNRKRPRGRAVLALTIFFVGTCDTQ